MISSLLTPMRWYNTIHEQDRYSNDCDICDYQLISDKTRLLPFQFRRPASGYLINKWFLRKACTGPYTELLNSNDSLFTLDTGFWTKSNFSFVNGKIKGTTATAILERLAILTPGKYYDIKIVVGEVKKTGSYNVIVSTNSGTILSFNQTGTFSTIFLAGAGDTDFNITTTFAVGTDYVIIDSIEINEIISFSTGIGDIDLPITSLYTVNAGTQDIIAYCGSTFDFQLPCGHYYMIMTSEDNTMYYSEVISVKDFIPSQSPYPLLEWKNSCDLSDLSYKYFESCPYYNRLYIDGPITKPEYPFSEQGEEDGNENLNITFQKWEKKQSLIAPKCPEFIVDALTSIRLHDTIQLTKPLRKKQKQVLSAEEIDKVEYDLQPVFNECATNVELKMLLKDKVVDSSCCVDLGITACKECLYTFFDYDAFLTTFDGILYFGTPVPGDDFGLYEITSLSLDAVTGKITGSPLPGFQYQIAGDQTLIYPVGTKIRVTGTSVGNDGIHVVSAVAYDSGVNKTSIQWVGINTDLGDITFETIEKISYTNISADGMLICVDTETNPLYCFGAELWKVVPSIASATQDLTSYTLQGYVMPGTYIQIDVEVYNGTTTTAVILPPHAYTPAQFLAGINILKSLITTGIPEDGYVKFTVNSYTVNCQYGNVAHTYTYVSGLPE